MIREVRTDRAPAPKAPYSQGVIAGGFVFVSGQGPVDPATGDFVVGSFEEQAILTLDCLKAVVEAAGGTLFDAVKVGIYLKDMANFPALNQLYARYFSAPYPARTTVQSNLPGFEIEIDAIVRLAES